jgi:hypothetical protein
VEQHFVEFIINLPNSGKFLHQEAHQSKFLEFANSEAFTWSVIPPHSPNFGELWEDGVHCIQYHLERLVGFTAFTFKKPNTLLTLVEACLIFTL